MIAIDTAPAKLRAPYDVQIVSEDGDTTPTYAFKGRYYVQGNTGERYTIRVTNPTARRVEAVVSVDGLDVVDGENGDLRKRGYIVPAYGEVRIEGFRTSLDDVATFRFSSVDGSYAGQKGKARNVGVIAVAIFEETAPPPEQQIVQPRPYRWEDDLDARAPAPPPTGVRGGYAKGDATKSAGHAAEKRAAPPPAEAPSAGGYGGAPSTAQVAPRHEAVDEDGGDYEAPRTNRPGLGTEFGESRTSAELGAETHALRARSEPPRCDRRAPLQRRGRPDRARHPGPADARRGRAHDARDGRPVPRRRPLRAPRAVTPALVRSEPVLPRHFGRSHRRRRLALRPAALRSGSSASPELLGNPGSSRTSAGVRDALRSRRTGS
jgi:hypothetical protein